MNNNNSPAGMNLMHFGNLLKEYREDHNLTQRELAEMLGVCHQTVSGYETARICMRVDVLYKYMQIFPYCIYEIFKLPPAKENVLVRISTDEQVLIMLIRDWLERISK